MHTHCPHCLTYRTAPRRSGFTLIELMVALVIVAILAAIALPSYKAYVQKGHRAAAQSHLLHLATFQNEYFADGRSYADQTAMDAANSNPSSLTGKYDFYVTANAGPPQTFSLIARPVATGPMAGTPDLEILSNGTKLPTDLW